jgi:outer membrane receptor protein involved in Fe transport
LELLIEGGNMFRLKKFGQLLIVLLTICLICPQTSLLSQEKSQQEEEKKVDELFKLSLEELMKIKIKTAGKREEKIADIPASVVLITRKDIEAYGYRTLTEILENIPGLYAIDDYSDNFSNFGVRGFWSGVANDNMIILVNDVHQINDLDSNYPLSKIAVPVEAIDRIEVIRGPMSVVYGNGAFYGVINIFTNDNSYRPVNIIGSSIGSEKTKKLFLRVSGKEGDFNYTFNSSFYDTYGNDVPLKDTVTDPSTLLFLGITEDYRTDGKLENNEKYFNFSGSYKHFFLNLSYNESKREFIAYFPSPPNTNGSYIRSTATDISFGYRSELSDKLEVEAKFSYSSNRDRFEFELLFEDFYGIQQDETNGYEAELNAFFHPSSNLDITTGTYYRTVLNASDMADLPSFGIPSIDNRYSYLADDDNIDTLAVFTQIDYNPFDSLSLVVGVRLEQTPKYELIYSQAIEPGPSNIISDIYDRDKVEIIPRFATIYYLNNHNIFKFLFGKAINRPSFAQNFRTQLLSMRPSLKPESIQTFELNYIGTLSSNVRINASIFRNTLENLITRVIEFDEDYNYQTWSANAGKMITTGVELTLNAEPFEDFRVELSGIYQKTKDKRVGYEDIGAAYSPNFLGYLKAYYRTKKFTFAVTGNYVGSMETFWDETIENPDGTFGARIGKKVDGYFVLGANLRIEDLFLRGLYLNIRCSNLFDEEIRYPTTTENPWATRGTIGYGRLFLVSLGYKF